MFRYQPSWRVRELLKVKRIPAHLAPSPGTPMASPPVVSTTGVQPFFHPGRGFVAAGAARAALALRQVAACGVPVQPNLLRPLRCMPGGQVQGAEEPLAVQPPLPKGRGILRMPPISVKSLGPTGDLGSIFSRISLTPQPKAVGGAEPARLGFVVCLPEVTAPDGTVIEQERWRHSEYVVSPEEMALLEDREQYITQLELLAAVAVYTSLPAEDLQGRDVLHWIDNTGALAILAKAYSSDYDCSRILHAFEELQLSLQVVPYFAYVRSEANVADLPSRGQADVVERELGSEYVTTTVPGLDGWARAPPSQGRARTSRGKKRSHGGEAQ